MPSTKPAEVAPFRPVVRRDCQQLGVCQAREPRCDACDDCDEPLDSFERVAMWAVCGTALGLTVAVVVGSVSYLLHRHGWLTP
jgi:hypothetical protein